MAECAPCSREQRPAPRLMIARAIIRSIVLPTREDETLLTRRQVRPRMVRRRYAQQEMPGPGIDGQSRAVRPGARRRVRGDRGRPGAGEVREGDAMGGS